MDWRGGDVDSLPCPCPIFGRLLRAGLLQCQAPTQNAHFSVRPPVIALAQEDIAYPSELEAASMAPGPPVTSPRQRMKTGIRN